MNNDNNDITIDAIESGKLYRKKTLYHRVFKNADGTPQRWRVNGKVKRWKTRPTEFRIPVKHGLYNYDYVTHNNAHLLSLSESDAKQGLKD